MPYRKEQFETDNIYHVMLRGLDDNLIFKDVNDYYRGIFSIYEFNNANSIEIRKRRQARRREKQKEKSGDPMSDFDKREKFVDILCFCFMPNHVHLLVKQLKDNGITKFMRKVGAGYGRYFNSRYNRKGYVFQNRFKSVSIENDNQFRIIFNYIHSNPISLIEPGWKEVGIKDVNKVVNFLEDYKWSSYKDYLNMNNFSSVTERSFMSDFMGGVKGCRLAIKNWLDCKKKLDQSQNILLE